MPDSTLSYRRSPKPLLTTVTSDLNRPPPKIRWIIKSPPRHRVRPLHRLPFSRSRAPSTPALPYSFPKASHLRHSFTWKRNHANARALSLGTNTDAEPGSNACVEQYTVRVEREFTTTCTVIRSRARRHSPFLSLFMRRRRGLHSYAKCGSLTNLGWLAIIQSSSAKGTAEAKETLSTRPVEVSVSVSVVTESRVQDWEN